MELVQRFTIEALPEKIGGVLCAEAFNIEIDRQREEVIHTEFRFIEQHDGDLHFEVRSEEYARTKTGAIDRNKTIHSITRHRYSSSKRTLVWTYEGSGSRWVTVSGTYHLNPIGKGTEVTHRVHIEVHIPLIGNQIAKLVAREFDKALVRFKDTLRRHVEGASQDSMV